MKPDILPTVASHDELTPEEINALQVLSDPVLWAKLEYDWDSRWYQTEILHCKDRKIVIRAGRRCGKCLPGDVEILDPFTGQLVKVEDLYQHGHANTVTMNSLLKLEPTSRCMVYDNGKKKVFRVQLKSGREIDATGNHPLFTPGGWKEIENLKPGDYVAVPAALPYFGNNSIEDCRVDFLAYVIGKGRYRRNRLQIAGIRPELVKRLEECIKNFGPFILKRCGVDSYDIVRKFPVTGRHEIHEYLKKAGLWNCDEGKKFVPETIFTLNKEQIAGFLFRLFAVNSESRFCYCSRSYRLIQQVRHLLLRFGINAVISRTKGKLFNKFPVYQLSIKTADDELKFIDEIGILDGQVPVVFSSSEEQEEPGVRWDKIASIKSTGYRRTYDLTVPETYNFVANDIVTHNTDSLVTKALWYAYVQPNRDLRKGERGRYVVLYVAPYEPQVNEFFTRIRELIGKSKNLNSSVIRDVRDPHEIEFANGAVIRGMTAGSKTGKGAASTRGQKADLLILDEVDYMTEKDITTLLSITLEDPKRIEVIAASTPSGADSHFKRWCLVKELGWSQFHYPSWVNPNWGPEMETELREELTGEGYRLEVEAEFGEEAAGVFQKQFLDLALKLGETFGGTYKSPADPKTGPRVMGVDWDKYAAGTNIVIVEYNTDMGLYMPIYREEIPRSRFTLGNAVRKVAELNEMYNLDYIYVDRGLGERQVEEFHEYGLANPASGMHEKVKGVTFRDTIKVRDPHTKEVVKKPLKYWMINNAVIIFERGKIALHPSDRLVYKQFSNYRIVSRSMYGYKFSEKDDHIVDALCLALHGLIMHYSDICKVKAGSKLLPVTNIFAKSDRFSVKRKPLIQAVGESFLQPFLRRSKSFGSTKRSRF